MKILLLELDLFENINKKSIFYKQKIIDNPKTEFFVFTTKKSNDFLNCSNINFIQYKELRNLKIKNTASNFLKKGYRQANEFAISVQNLNFDYIEFSDDFLGGIFIRAAMKRYNVFFSKIILNIFENYLSKLDMDFSEDSINEKLELKNTIKANYLIADFKFTFSQILKNELELSTNSNFIFLDPSLFFNKNKMKISQNNHNKPNIYFLGDLNFSAGIDLFLQLLSMMDKNLYNSCNIIRTFNSNWEKYNEGQLTHLLFQRDLKLNFLTLSKDNYNEILAQNSIFFIPSRSDSFNFLASDAFFKGSTIILEKKSGLYKYLLRNFLNLRTIGIDSANLFESLQDITNVLLNNLKIKEDKINNLDGKEFKNNKFSLEEFCKNNRSFLNTSVIDECEKKYNEFNKWEKKEFFKTCIIKFLPKILKKILGNIFIIFSKDSIKRYLRRYISFRFIYKIYKHLSIYSKIEKIILLNEDNKKQINYKLKNLLMLAKYNSIGRVKLYRNIARIERQLNNNLNACTYDLRIMRLLGHDKYHMLPIVLKELNQLGFVNEAKVAEIMFNNNEDQQIKAETFLKDRYKKLLKMPKYEYEFIDDLRKKECYKVGIIISLYNAADKLKLFISAISNQTLLKTHEAELIFIETGSLKEDYKIFQEMKNTLNIPMVYARTSHRETIQSAWNRAITLSKSKYLCFLGVDEMIVPNALEILSKKLDNNSDIDWIQADCIVVQVDKNGNWKNDNMFFNRKGYKQELFYLETCYLSWVGALYKKSIHERFGYYDPSFCAAGDNEFKNRILPYIKSMHYPKILGYFWHYPDGQSTLSPKGEIEDLRAWFLHKTKSGINYAFNKMPLNKLEEIFYDALKYRKSYHNEVDKSSFIDYADSIIEYINDKYPNSQIIKYRKEIKKYLKLHRNLEENRIYLLHIIILKLFIRKKIFKNLNFFNDNRYENYCFPWGI
jgi:glycosyltransferase involved in cell wall biosynthesis